MLAASAGIYAAVIGTLLGAMVELVYSVWIRRRYVKYTPSARFKDPHVVRSLKMAIPVAIGISIEELNKIIDKAIASSLEEGSISALHYASKISSGISNHLISSISVVFYPEYAKKAAEGDDQGLADTYGVSINLFLLIIVPLIAGGFFLRNEIVSLVYGRGAFDATSLAMTAPLFVGYLACLLFTSVRQSCSNLFNSYGETRIPAINTVIGVVINIVLNFILSHFLGAFGLVLATLIASAVTGVLLMISVRRRNRFVRYGKNLWLLVKTAAAALLMLAALLPVRLLFNALFGGVTGVFLLLLYLAVAVTLGAIVYTVSLYVLRVREIKMMLGLIKKFVKRKK
jgi:putative peptidoglycan lipid II flippase